MAEQTKDDKPFLSRWSERKRAVRAEEEAPADASEDAAPPAERQAELEANRAAAEAIDLETLTDTSDYAPFLRAGVPSALKHAALRKLWRSNPVFAVLDGLNDYDLDYRWPVKGAEVVKTAWKAGRGFLAGDDEAPAAEPTVPKPAGDAVAADARPEPESAAEGPSAAAEEEAASEASDAPGAVAADTTPPETDAREPVKVSLARRLDLAAFAKEEKRG